MTAFVVDICDQCGNPRSVCSDPKQNFFANRTMCYATAAREQLLRMVSDKYGEPDGVKPHPTDGMSVDVSTEDLNPDDEFV